MRISMADHNGFTRRDFVGSCAAFGISSIPAFSVSAAESVPEEETREITRMLARFVVQSKPADIPDAARKEAVRSIVNYTGCAVGGSKHETLDRALAALDEFSGPRQATVLGRKERLDIFHAALMNGISSHVLDYDDTHLKTIIHPAGPVVSAILALAERRPVTGTDFLHAFILGAEVECRIGNAVYPAHYDAGWHITGTAGVFGAAAAAGKIMGISEQQMVWALGTAATQASGLREMFGSMCKGFHVGRAAQNGLAAAMLASKDFTSSDRGIEASRGFAFVLSPARNFSAIEKDLGKTWEITENTYKPFPCGIVIHPVIDGCIQLRNENKLDPVQIEQVSLRVHPLVLELTGKKIPTSGLEGKFSVYHAAAVAIIRGAAGIQEFSDEAVRNRSVVALRDRVTVATDPKVKEVEAYITIGLRDGRKLTKYVPVAVGSLERPMSDAQLEAKFRGLADGVLARPQQDKLLELCWSVEKLAGAAAIARASAP
jgi:2-methylcitrate dehydratase PrpD